MTITVASRQNPIMGEAAIAQLNGVVARGTDDVINVLFLPYGQQAEAVVAAALGGTQNGE